MNELLAEIKTVILVMFENRSFDHMLGHISLDNNASAIEGLRTPLDKYANIYEGGSYDSFQIPVDTTLEFDLPHEYDYVAMQLAQNPVNKQYAMNGFVAAYAKSTKLNPNPQCEPMGYFSAAQVPITNFIATNFCTCNQWFAPLPTSTQPNRTMAFCGDSKIYSTATRLIPIDDSIFKWMDRAGVNWRVYHDGFSFFSLYQPLWKYVLGSKFKPYKSFTDDMLNEPVADTPQVIIVEPTYQDAPHLGSSHPNDNHAPLAIGWGEDFLRRTYEAVTANKQKFGNTVMVVYYDEHGGFYDHTPPRPVSYTVNTDPPYNFNSLGPRVPGFIISPFVKPGSVCNNLFDHTSVLQFLAELFTPGKPYNQTVDERSRQGLGSISSVLNNTDSWPPPVAPGTPINVSSELGLTIATEPQSVMAQSFELAANQLLANQPDKTRKKYPELSAWKVAVDNRRK
jgi:phospholipase C